MDDLLEREVERCCKDFDLTDGHSPRLARTPPLPRLWPRAGNDPRYGAHGELTGGGLVGLYEVVEHGNDGFFE